MRPPILVPTDFSECAMAALAAAIHRFPESPIVVVHVVDPVQARAVADVTRDAEEEVIETMWSRASRRLAEEKQSIETEEGRHVETIVSKGAPATEIVRIARERTAELIVLGSHGATRDPAVTQFGGTAERVVLLSPVPVLCIPCP